MNNDLISREALKKQVKELLDLAVKRVDDTPNNSPCYRMYIAQEEERARLIDLIDNAPTVKCGDFCDIETQLLGAELHGMKIGYKDAQKKLTRPQGKWIFDGCTTYCSECGYKPTLGGDNYCPNCGAKMTKDTKQ